MHDLPELARLAPGSSVLVLGDRGAVAELGRAGCRVTESKLTGPPADPVLPFAPGSFDLVLLDEALGEGSEVEAMLSEAVRVARPGGLVAIRLHDTGAAPSRDELCAHFAGELLGVEEHAEEPVAGSDPRTTWLLRVPGAEPVPGGDR